MNMSEENSTDYSGAEKVNLAQLVRNLSLRDDVFTALKTVLSDVEISEDQLHDLTQSILFQKQIALEAADQFNAPYSQAREAEFYGHVEDLFREYQILDCTRYVWEE